MDNDIVWSSGESTPSLIERETSKHSLKLNGIRNNELILTIVYIERIMLTEAKKQYASKVTMQEGVLYKKADIDLKGLAIKKVSTNKRSRAKFEEILEKDILDDNEIDITKIIRKYKLFEQEIATSLKSGNLDFAIPAKVNKAENYVAPYSIPSFRGSLAWNILFPENEIQFPSRVLNVKLKIDSFDQIKENIDDEEILNKFKRIYGNPDLVKKGIEIISIPPDSKEIPKFLIPFIDIEFIVNSNIKSGLPMLKSLGVITLPILQDEFPSNIVRF
mgnify:CR=1 FL=1